MTLEEFTRLAKAIRVQLAHGGLYVKEIEYDELREVFDLAARQLGTSMEQMRKEGK